MKTQGTAIAVNESELPAFQGESWEDHISAWLEESSNLKERQLNLAAVAFSVHEKWKEQGVLKFAGEVGWKAKNVYHYIKVYEMVSESTRVDLLNSPLTFSHLRIAAYVPNEKLREKILTEAEDGNLSVQAMQKRIKELSNGHSSHARKSTPIAKPSMRSAARPVQEFIHSIKSKGGAVSFVGGLSEREQIDFRDELITCRNELDKFVDELTDHFDTMSTTNF